MRCDDCRVEITGQWRSCPLCGGDVSGEPLPAPQPDVPLRYDRQRLFLLLVGLSLLLIVGSFVAVRFLSDKVSALGIVWFSLASMWAVALLVVRKRRNVAKVIVYLVAAVALLSLYADHMWGWQRWSINWVIPIVTGSAIVAIFVSVAIARMRADDYIMYLWSAAILGLLPGIALAFGWVGQVIPSWISVGLAALAALFALLLHRRVAVNELRKRLSF